MRSWFVTAACLALCACDGTAPPNAPAVVPATPGWAAGTVLHVVSGETGEPVAGAAVVIGGRRYETNATGQATLDARAADFTPLDVVAGGFLDRQTWVRSTEGTGLALWPRESPTGLNEHQTAELVYTPGARCCPAEVLGRDPLYLVSPAIPAFAVVLDPQYRGYPGTVAALEEACGLAGAATRGRVVFRMADARSGPTIEVTSGPDPLGRSLVAAFAERTFDAGGYITGGRVVAVDPDFLTEGWRYVDTVQLFVHELGHMLGLNHSTAPGVMGVFEDRSLGYGYFRAHGDYSPAEKLTLHLMFGRRAGNRFPDNDRGPAAASAHGDRIVCPR